MRDELLGDFDLESLRCMASEMQRRIENCRRTEPQPKMSERALLRLEREQAKRQRIEEQLRLEGEEVTPAVSAANHPK